MRRRRRYCETVTRIYGHEFRNQVAIMNMNEVLSTPRSPGQRAYVERVIGAQFAEKLWTT